MPCRSRLLSTLLDVAPIVGILVFFQIVVLRRRLPNPRRMIAGFVMVLLGLALFLIGLEEALFPIGETMARQLTAPDTIGTQSLAGSIDWRDYLLVYAFAGAIGFCHDDRRTLAHCRGGQGRGCLRGRNPRLGLAGWP